MTEFDYYHQYLEDMKKVYGKPDGETTEMSGRGELKKFLDAVKSTINKDIEVIHEPAREGGSAPDFKIQKTSAIIGYVENKEIRKDLDETVKGPQIIRYKKLNKNILLTNYHEWIWIKDDLPLQKVSLFPKGELANPKFRLPPEKIEELDKILHGFFGNKPEPIANASELAEALAVRTHHLNEYIVKVLDRGIGGKLQGLYDAFKIQLHPQLTHEQFADAYAQTLTYGLFLARLNAAENLKIELHTAKRYIPQPFALMKELVGFLDELEEPQYIKIKWVVEEILYIINYMDREAISTELSFKFRSSRSLFKGKDKEEFDMFSSDPFMYFYEDFLKAYDAKLRKKRGVYYTPPPIVNFITRALNHILKDTFNIADGFANAEKVTVLDFACGTGTFMLDIFQLILENFDSAKDGAAEKIIRNHLLKNIYGFEYLIAAYAIAHLKLWQFLKDKDYDFETGERLQILLTNTLEEAKEAEPNFLVPKLADEAKLGSEVKDKNILVVTGNPPYSGSSQIPGRIGKKLTWIGELIEDYKLVDGVSINERAAKWLQDDYVKFIRFAQHKMKNLEEGAIGIITNHAFIDNPTFRGMRQSLMNDFDQIYILDLHGNAHQKEKSPDGSVDKNVFDIMQGVAISFFIKKKGLPEKEKGIFHFDLWGDRKFKYKWALATDFASIAWEKLSPISPDYLFIPQNKDLKPEYNLNLSVKEIFNLNSVGVLTVKDKLVIQFTEEEMQETVEKFASMSSEKARQHFKLGDDSRDWKVARAQEDVKKSGKDLKKILPILFRPFDKRYTYYTGKSAGFCCWPRKKVMSHMLQENLALVTVRQVAEEKFSHAFVSENLTDFRTTLSNKGGAYVFPLYLYSSKDNKTEELYNFTDSCKKENFKKEFRDYINNKYDKKFSPEEILSYIYAILNCPIYRERYRQFLKQDYPRIPFCDSNKGFLELVKIGKNIMELHLMNAPLVQGNLKLWKGKGNDFVVRDISYNNEVEKVSINDQKYLQPIKKEVWEFETCGYKPLEKYLKSHKGRELKLEDLRHITKIVDSIEKTLLEMKNLDKLTEKIFPHWHES